MAITRTLQARTTVPAALHSHLHVNKHKLLKKGIEILSETQNSDGTVTLVLCGQGLGKAAVPVPPPCTVAVDASGDITIQPIE